jgi:hypothetical protein
MSPVRSLRYRLLMALLQNRIYRGEILHQGTAYPGQHEAILDLELWQIVQDKLAANRQEHSLAVGAEAPSLLAGLIVDAGGHRMTPAHATKKAKRYRYYVSSRFWLEPARKHRKGCASRRVIWKGWCSSGLGRFSRAGPTSVTRSPRSILRLARLMRPNVWVRGANGRRVSRGHFRVVGCGACPLGKTHGSALLRGIKSAKSS